MISTFSCVTCDSHSDLDEICWMCHGPLCRECRVMLLLPGKIRSPACPACVGKVMGPFVGMDKRRYTLFSKIFTPKEQQALRRYSLSQ